MAESQSAKDTTPDAAAPSAASTPSDEARRQRTHVERLLARPAAQSRASVVAGGQRLDYRVHAAFLPVLPAGLASASGEPEAAVLATAYQLEGANAAERPVCFAFNGGPGSASVWLHLGALGPRRVVVPDDGSAPRPPFAVQDNPHTWLKHFDLVFIDPPHTGWSACASDAARKKLLSVDGDVAALAEVMRGWLTQHRRWGSAVYLAGESYGTTRGAALADALLAMGVGVAGAVLVSCAMDLQSIAFAPANDLPYALFLPGFANVAQYHGLLGGAAGADPAAARAAAEAFVQEEYVAALHAGARLGERQRTRIARRIAELTGLARGLVEEKNLRVADVHFFFEALRHRGLQVGRLDARGTGPLGASRGREFEFDPGIEAIAAPYTTAAMAYFAELGLDLPQRYEVLNLDVNHSWNWTRGDSTRMGFASTTSDLARALRRAPHFKVLAASGRYDLGTPYSATDWSLAQLDVPADVMARVTHRYYDAGHMMYTRQADLVQLEADLASWLAT
jgi:carboxypeptidase C (cathepsin A)